MSVNKILPVLICFCFSAIGIAQKGSIKGFVHSNNDPLGFTQVYIPELNTGTVADSTGTFEFDQVPYGSYRLELSFVGFKTKEVDFVLNEDQPTIELEIGMKALLMMDEVVVTGTKTFKRKTNSPVIVNVLNSESMNNVQACNLSDGLRFQPGLRVETDCQTCNYTQLRMNGLAGGYSQILINGRPIFSPLTGLYGMEQLPVNMIEKIEVVRGGGSSLYGSSAIGGTVNVITKIPKENAYSLTMNHENINNDARDLQLSGNASIVSSAENSGITFFINSRNRDFYDHNGDNFSELPKINNKAFGINAFILPTANQKIEISLSNLNEYRLGGEMVEKPAYLMQQSEERTHDVWMASTDYQINFNDGKSSLITYLAWQNTVRDHYTGIIPDDIQLYQNHINNPPYGDSEVSTYNTGIQFNHKLERFLGGQNVFTLGTEYVFDKVYDEIPAYSYLVDQATRNTGAFIQSDWLIVPNLTLLSGVRADWHNLVDHVVLNPRVSLLYKLKDYTQFRLSYGTGFRAPQAFDTDLHIAFAGGGVSRVRLSPQLEPETSESFSASINFDHPTETFIFGFTLESFYTRLYNAFYLEPTGEDEFGVVFEKRNGTGALVSGGTLELRANYNQKLQLESGFTLQASQYNEDVNYIPGIEGIQEFIRTPNDYGYAMLSWMPNNNWSGNLNYVYTGSMILPHFAGAPNQEVDEMFTTSPFHQLSVKASYGMNVKSMDSRIEFFGGVKNIFNSYQRDFDIGKNRDSNYIYGPSQPRTFFIGFKLSSIQF